MPPTSSAPSVPSVAAARMPVGVTSCGGRQFGDVPAPRRPARGRCRRRADGRRAAAPAARRPPARRARRRVAAPTPAGPRWLSASRAAADNPPGTVARRSPTMMTAPGRGQQRSPDFAGGQAVQRRRLGAGSGLEQPAGHLRQRAGGERGDRVHRQRRACGPPCAAAGTRSATRPPVRTRPAAPPAPTPDRSS